ncbi:carbonic anhydrase 2-like [Parasteatoda tepidariorum]|uniref:carbonic anhydrase 2-like n=1 Tax=Parasteatoda tepidariorum TaxID=114398 RepID=UPI0039BD13A4
MFCRSRTGHFKDMRLEIEKKQQLTILSKLQHSSICEVHLRLLLHYCPKFWGETFPACYGRKQSPIDIVTVDIVKDKNLGRLQLTNYDVPLTRAIYENNGHSIKVTPKDDVLRSVHVNGEKFQLAQFHFHWGGYYYTGSEHTVDKKHYALEVQVLIFSIYQLSILNSTGMQPISDMLQFLLYKGTKLDVKGDINLNKLVENGCSYYRYDGSLTTPGCDEGVIWTVCKNPLRIGILQLLEFRQVYSEGKTNGVEISECTITGNHRPIQPINRRTIRSSV